MNDGDSIGRIKVMTNASMAGAWVTERQRKGHVCRAAAGMADMADTLGEHSVHFCCCRGAEAGHCTLWAIRAMEQCLRLYT